MGLDISADGYPDDFSIGYIGFGMLRVLVARSVFGDEKGEIYGGIYRIYFSDGEQEKYIKQHSEVFNEFNDHPIGVLLNHCDSGGTLTSKECSAMIPHLDKITELDFPEDSHPEAIEKFTKKYNALKELIRHCAVNRVTAYFH